MGGWEALPRKESLLLVFGNHDYQVMCFFPQGKIDVGEGNHNWWNQHANHYLINDFFRSK